MVFLNEQIREVIKKALGAKLNGQDIKVEYPADAQYGDYSTNISLQMAKVEKNRRVSLPRKLLPQ